MLPAIVTAMVGQSLTIRFEDGAVVTLQGSEVQPLAWAAGALIECRAPSGDWQDVRVVALAEDRNSLTVRQSSDVSIDIAIGLCRTPTYP